MAYSTQAYNGTASSPQASAKGNTKGTDMRIIPFGDGAIAINSENISIAAFGTYSDKKLGEVYDNNFSTISYEKFINQKNNDLASEVRDWYENYKPLSKIKKENKMNRTDIEINKFYTTDYTNEIFLVLKKGDTKVIGSRLKGDRGEASYAHYNSSLVGEFIPKDFIESKEKNIREQIKNLRLLYNEEDNIIKFIGADFNIPDIEHSVYLSRKVILQHIEDSFQVIKDTMKAGTNLNVAHAVIDDYEPEVTIEVNGDNIISKYSSIVSNVSEITKNINSGSALDNHKEIADAFIKAKKEISKLSTVKPSKFGYVGKWLTDNNILKSTIENAKEEKTRNQSTQDNIDYLFGVVYTKYEDLIETGKGLQKSKLEMKKQIELLEELNLESDEMTSAYINTADIPMDILAISTQIKTSIEKYKQRLTKIDGAIIATQTTITSLAKDLPAMKNDLTDEMAISTLLGSVDDYQVMYQEIAGLVSEVTTATAEKTHVVIENLLQLQIDDTHTMKYLIDSGTRAKKFATMLEDKTVKLSKKVHRDAEFIGDIAKGNTIEHARSKFKLLK